jgi:hypothetical protein
MNGYLEVESPTFRKLSLKLLHMNDSKFHIGIQTHIGERQVVLGQRPYSKIAVALKVKAD